MGEDKGSTSETEKKQVEVEKGNDSRNREGREFAGFKEIMLLLPSLLFSCYCRATDTLYAIADANGTAYERPP